MPPRSWIWVGLGLLLSCGGPRENAAKTTPEPEPELARPGAAVTEPKPPPSSSGRDFAELEALALACDGVGIQAALAELDPEAIADPHADAAASVRLLAGWEQTRTFTSDGSLDPAAVEALVAALTVELGHAPPSWWIETLASGKRREAEGSEAGPVFDRATPSAGFYDVEWTGKGDRRGPVVDAPGRNLMRPDSGILESKPGQLAYDLSVGRLELGPVPERSGTMLELSRARAGSTVYFSSWAAGGGGFRFPLRAISLHDGLIWEAVVCGPDRKMLGGLSYMIAEILVLEPGPDPTVGPGIMQPSRPATGIAVFTAEGHGVALDMFDPQTGARTLAWSSDFWFSR